MQSGFIGEAEKYIELSIDYDPGNLYAYILEAYILFARDKDLAQTKNLLMEAHEKDTTRYDIIREIGLICYYMRDYQSAYNYFMKMIEITDAQNLDVYKGDKSKIGLIFSKLGFTDESERYFKEYLDYAENDESIYKHLSLAVYNAYFGNTDKATENLELFSQQENYPYWYILFLEIDPLVDRIKDDPEFRRIMDNMEAKYWKNHERIRKSLEAKKLI
jgi:tetratricopeptide (TPR) repeat protein